MKWFNKYREAILMDEAGGDGGGDSGAGAHDLTSGDGGGVDSSGGTGSGDSGSSGDGGKNNSPAAKDPKGGSSSDWRSTLPKELQDNETLKKYASVSDLAGAYINAAKLIGGDKIPVPNPKTTTDQDWEKIYDKLGRPALDKYEVKFGDDKSVDKDFAEAFRTNAHKAGLLPKQAQALADWFNGRRTETEQKYLADRNNYVKEQVEGLKKDWGNAFEAKIGRVNKMLKDAGAMEHFKKQGYGTDAQLYKFLDSFADKLYKDHKLVDGATGKSVRTKEEIQAQIAKLHADPAYTTKDHPAHNATVKEMQALYEELHPAVDKK